MSSPSPPVTHAPLTGATGADASGPPDAAAPAHAVPLEALAGVLGHGASDKRIDILARIAECGSISEAARRCGVSYKAAWQALETLHNLAGVALVSKAVGGSGGGGAVLTTAGRKVLAVARELDQARAEVLARVTMQDRAEPAGPTLTGSPIGTDADTETADATAGADLSGSPTAPTAPTAATSVGLAALALRTSLRNQFPCTVQSLQAVRGQMLVRLRTAGGDTLDSRITRESAQLLGLRAGLPVLALFKATAVRVAPQGPAQDEDVNRLSGTVTRASRDANEGEVTLALAGGIHVVGFAAGEEPVPRLRKGARAQAAVDASAVVIASA
jgi:molybdate transport system regulatory protein